VVSKSYQFSRHVLGIRTNSETAGQWLTDTFGDDELVGEETDPYFSLYMANGERGSARSSTSSPRGDGSRSGARRSRDRPQARG
jgi:hypothetical protein